MSKTMKWGACLTHVLHIHINVPRIVCGYTFAKVLTRSQHLWERDISSGMHHVINPSRFSPPFSNCK